MTRSDDFDHRIEPFARRLEPQLAATASFEDAARIFARVLYEEFRDLVVLARVFAVVPFRRLGAGDRAFVERSLERAAHAELTGSTPVLTLFGTRGIEERWNDRTQSRDHRAIALISEAFVEEAPMIAKLFAEIDTVPRRAADGDWQFVRKTADGDGLFFVGDARTTTDPRGRHVIPSEDFVERYGVRTVFGFGTHAVESDIVIAVIVFCSKTLMRPVAQRFTSTIEVLRSATREAIARDALFADQADAEPA